MISCLRTRVHKQPIIALYFMKWNLAEQMEQANWGRTGGLRWNRRDATER